MVTVQNEAINRNVRYNSSFLAVISLILTVTNKMTEMLLTVCF